MLRLVKGPFRYQRYADIYIDFAKRYTRLPIKQAVISPSALSLMYPADPIPGYSRDEFINDLLAEHVTEVRRCLQKGAHCVQIDFTEGRLAIKIDPSGNLLNSFIDLNNLALSRLTAEERTRVGVHTCPGGDRDSTHSADVDYAELLPSLFELRVTNFYIALAGEEDRPHVLKVIREYMKSGQRIFAGVVGLIDPHIEPPEEICERIMARFPAVCFRAISTGRSFHHASVWRSGFGTVYREAFDRTARRNRQGRESRRRPWIYVLH